MMSNLKDITSEIEKMRSHFGWQKTDTSYSLVQSIVEESIELQQALSNNAMSEVAKELADVLMVSITLANDLNLDIYQIISDKAKEVMEREYK